MKCLAHLIPIFLGSIITRRKNCLNLYLKGDTQLRCNFNECCSTTSSPQSFPLRSSQLCTGTGGKSRIKGAIDGLVQVWHPLLFCMEEEDGKGNYLVSIPLQWKVLCWFELILNTRQFVFYSYNFQSFVSSIPGTISKRRKCNKTLIFWHSTIQISNIGKVKNCKPQWVSLWEAFLVWNYHFFDACFTHSSRSDKKLVWRQIREWCTAH